MDWSIKPLDETVEKELLALPADMQARFLHISELLCRFGPQNVGMPHVRPLGKKLWEIRLGGKSGIGRVIYTASSSRRLILLHAFVKKTNKTPRRSYNLARERLKNLEK